MSCGTGKKAIEPINTEGESQPVKKLKVSQHDASSYSTIYDYLRVKVPGVQVVGTTITIRGVRSINSGTAPLIIVDGNAMKYLRHQFSGNEVSFPSGYPGTPCISLPIRGHG